MEFISPRMRMCRAYLQDLVKTRSSICCRPLNLWSYFEASLFIHSSILGSRQVPWQIRLFFNWDVCRIRVVYSVWRTSCRASSPSLLFSRLLVHSSLHFRHWKQRLVSFEWPFAWIFLSYFLSSVAIFRSNQIVACLDNHGAASCLRGNAFDSSQEIFLRFQEIAATHGSKPTLAYVRRLARKHVGDAFQAWWQEHVPEQYKELGLNATSKCPKDFRFPGLPPSPPSGTPRGLCWLPWEVQTRRRMHDLLMRPSWSPGPSLLLPRGPHHRTRLSPSPTVTISRAIGRDFEKFTQMARTSSFFTRIGQRVGDREFRQRAGNGCSSCLPWWADVVWLRLEV